MKKLIISLIISFSLALSCYAGVTLDGSDDCVEITHDSTLNLASAFTISVWVNVNAHSSWSGIVAKQAVATCVNPYFTYALTLTDVTNQIRFSTALSSDQKFSLTTAADNVLPYDGNWHHIVATFNGTTKKLYVDSSEVTISNSTAQTGNLDTSSLSLRIGLDNSDCNSYFDGDINEVTLWDTALSADEVSMLYNSKGRRMSLQIQPSNLQMYLPLDDEEDGSNADGDTFFDYSGNGNDGTGDDGANNTGCTAIGTNQLTNP